MSPLTDPFRLPPPPPKKRDDRLLRSKLEVVGSVGGTDCTPSLSEHVSSFGTGRGLDGIGRLQEEHHGSVRRGQVVPHRTGDRPLPGLLAVTSLPETFSPHDASSSLLPPHVTWCMYDPPNLATSLSVKCKSAPESTKCTTGHAVLTLNLSEDCFFVPNPHLILKIHNLLAIEGIYMI